MLDALIGVGGSLLSGLLGNSGNDREQTQQQTNEPWSGLIPYLTGGDQPPGFLYGTPDITRQWLEWAQGSGTGDSLAAPPAMMADYVRAQQGLGGPYDRVGSMPVQPQEAQPQQTGFPLYVPRYDYGVHVGYDTFEDVMKRLNQAPSPYDGFERG